MTKLHVSPKLALPADLATHITLIAGKRGSGKTNTAKRLVEQLHRARVPFGVLDPVDVWWGLKAGRDGTPEGGLDGVYVFGGRHAEYPLAPTGGALMADLFVDYRISAVMELREWSGADRARFVTAFAHRLLERNTEPFALIAEEAHDLMPQSPMGEEKGSLGAMLRLLKLGRSGGIGLVELTQRLAALNKTATTQADVLVMHRTTGPQDRKALNDWIVEHHASDEERTAFLRALPELKTGEAFVWAPDFPEDKPLGLQRHRILECETFNSHATPKVGEKRSEPKELRPADLARLSKAMSATVEKAKAEDPRALRARIRELEAAAAAANKVAAPRQVETKVERVEVAVLKNGALKQLNKAIAGMERITVRSEKVGELVAAAANDWLESAGAVRDTFAPVVRELQRIQSAPSAGVTSGRAPEGSAARVSPGSTVAPAVRTGSVRDHRLPEATTARSGSRRESAGPGRTTEGITTRQQRFLDAAATLTTLGAEVTRETVAGWVGVHPRGGSVGEELKALVDAGLITLDRGAIAVTDAGHAAAGEMPAEEAIERAMRGLSPRQRRIFDIVREVFPDGISREAIAERMGIHPRGGSFGEDLGRLRGRGLIDYQRGQARARDFLFVGVR